MKPPILFDLSTLQNGEKTIKKLIQYFTRAGVSVAAHDVGTQTKRSSGISYKELMFTMADSQTVTMRIKQTGDIFQVLINGRVQPIKNQEDQAKAVSEIVAVLDAGRTKFQQKLAKAKTALPGTIKTAAPKLEAVLIEKRDNLKEAIQAVREEIATIRGVAA